MLTIAFVIHGGELEVKASLLACSLRQKCHQGIRLCAVLMQPETRWGAVSEPALEILEKVGVEIIRSENKIDLDYPHGNKINALETIDGPTLFIDSDIILMRPFLTHHSFIDEDATAKPADFPTFERSGGRWEPVYDLFELKPPSTTVTATISQEQMLPYYNAGMIFVKNGKEFSSMWLDTALTIDASSSVQSKRPWLDQISLPVTFARLGWSVVEAGRDLNYPGHVEALPENGQYVPHIMHYHSPDRIGACPVMKRDVVFYRNKYPELNSLFESHENWFFLADKAQPKKPKLWSWRR